MSRVIPLIYTVSWLITSDAYSFFQQRIPNGDQVPHPCQPNILWKGVGHKNVAGSGIRNPFGVDFAANGQKWDRCLCERDSDSDGRTNGEELGDPNCVWTEGGIPEITDVLKISHPGVCQPLDDPICMEINDWSFCDYNDEFKCDALEDNTDITEVELRFPTTPVPAQETSYFCMTFDIPSDAEYHLIADVPLIDNKHVMHHALLYGCDDPQDGNEDWKLTEPTECGMSLATCRQVVALWTIGINGRCLDDKYGIRFGLGGFKTVNLQVHWNNPLRLGDSTDGSGLKLFLSKNLRPSDGATLMFGTDYLEIPPRMASFTQEGYCRSGQAGVIEHTRDGKIINLIEAESYSYDSPSIISFDDPIEFLPGDELKLTCNFKSISRSNTTFYGDGTAEEMCFGFATYYPAVDKFTFCATFRSLAICPPDGSFHPVGDCNETSLYAQAGPIMSEVLTACPLQSGCTESCEQVLTDLVQREPCLQGDIGLLLQYRSIARFFGDYGKQFVEALHVCDEDWNKAVIYGYPKQNDSGNGLDLTTVKASTPPGLNDKDCVFDSFSSAVTHGSLSCLAIFVCMMIGMTEL